MRLRCRYGTIRRRTDVTELLENMEGITDTMRGQIKQLGKFHDTDRLMISNRLCYFEMPAEEFNFIFHLLYHRRPAPTLRNVL
ncbi:MAG: hypothetical protein A4E34_01628 [Methanoregula sp. PtaU1.Bin006]|nr:MAG: hypothetical protein A4E33_02750 [Methanoregula sp. PtaB.Bin085]OPY34041.1 MAG: hypothetical protein A4E34_01628 [Methanoregula sp. PtaU1.Bin006]